jgi:hypothetical protein
MEALKWAALVFAAGFIGFFGKSLGRTIVDMFQKKKDVIPAVSKPPVHTSSLQNGLPSSSVQNLKSVGNHSKDEEKIIKKALKSQEKAVKKQGKE